MGYSTSVDAFELVKELLDILVEKPGEHAFPAEDTPRLAYLLRQGVFSAKVNGIEPHGSLNYRFLVKPDRVIAQPKLTTERTTGTKGLSTVRERISTFEIIIDLKKRDLKEGQEVIYEKFTGDLSPVARFVAANNLKILNEKPLHIGNPPE